MDEWVTVRETYRSGVASIQLEKYYNDYNINLVVTILPVIYTQDELAYEAERLLESSLYRPRSIQVERNQYIADHPVIVIDAIAGEVDSIFVRTVGFSMKGRSYFFTVLSREEAFSQATDELEKIIISIKSEQ